MMVGGNFLQPVIEGWIILETAKLLEQAATDPRRTANRLNHLTGEFRFDGQAGWL